MKGTVLTIHPDGSEVAKEYDRAPTLAELQAAVGGGYIQIVPKFEEFRGAVCVVFCDEDGKIKRQSPNHKATTHWAQNVRTGDYLVGSIAICYGDDEFFAAMIDDE